MSLLDSSVGGATASLFPAAKHSSESAEWYTPPEIVVAARALMGDIDLDPASCDLANAAMAAHAYFDEQANGFVRQWTGRVFLNPPGGYCDKRGARVVRASGKTPACTVTGACGLDPAHKHAGVRSAAKAWWEKLCTEYASGRVSQAVFLGFNAEVLRSTQESETPCVYFPFCIPKQRIRFLTPTADDLVPGAAPPHMSVIVWLPPRDPSGVALFERRYWLPRLEAAFGEIGACA